MLNTVSICYEDIFIFPFFGLPGGTLINSNKIRTYHMLAELTLLQHFSFTIYITINCIVVVALIRTLA